MAINIYIDSIRLPVIEPKYNIEEIHDNKEESIVGFGGVNLIGKKALKTFSYNSFYPNRYDSSYCLFSNLLKPEVFVNKILAIKNGKNVCRLRIPHLKINALYSIEGFSYREEDGTGDIYYAIQMKEYRLPTVNTAEYSFEINNSDFVKEEKSVPKQYYTVKEGDKIVELARSFNMSTKVLYDDNASVIGSNPTALKPGIKLWIRGNESESGS